MTSVGPVLFVPVRFDRPKIETSIDEEHFDPQLLKSLSEMIHWSQQVFQIPFFSIVTGRLFNKFFFIFFEIFYLAILRK